MQQILVTGAGGQLGNELCSRLGSQCIGIDQSDLDLTSESDVREFLRKIRPSTIINTAAFTAVDKAEETPERCYDVNANAVKYLAEEANRLGSTFVQISTDYVFTGNKPQTVPFAETEIPVPVGVYAKSKFLGEQHARNCPRHFIVRSCGLYGNAGPTSTGNFVTTMLRLGRERDSVSVVNDQHCTPTWVPELAAAVLFLATTDDFGTYHIVNSGATTWYDMAREIFRIADVNCEVRPITTAEYGAPAPRPAYSVLNADKYAKLGGPVMSSWQKALEKFIQTLGPNS